MSETQHTPDPNDGQEKQQGKTELVTWYFIPTKVDVNGKVTREPPPYLKLP